jgi:phosphoadenosine phosphosulfate reductase
MRIELQVKIVEAALLLQERGPYYLCFSGGKDSCVIKHLSQMAGVEFTTNYSVTTIDPPELTRFIKHNHSDAIWHKPKIPLLKMVKKKGLPSRFIRWCCKIYKEQGGNGEIKIMGVRASESANRKASWEPVMTRNKSICISPILYWTDEDVWEYIRYYKIPYCSLYDEPNIKRIGCVGCPASNRKREFARWPHMEKLWRKATKDRWDYRLNQNNGKPLPAQYRLFKNSDEWFDWWMSNKSYPNLGCSK